MSLSPPPTAAQLPPELYSAIIAHIPAAELQRTVLALTRALPRSPIPQYHLFEHVRLNDPVRVVQLYRRLRRPPAAQSADLNGDSAPGRFTDVFALESWTADADVVINTVRLLPCLRTLVLWIGPSNFAPEHLEELFTPPMSGVEHLALRFRPYVQKATYYQFLKGAYFDTTLHAISRWPDSHLSSLSIVQDPLEPGHAQKQAFAQPLVFFRLDPFTTLLRAPSLAPITALRLRVPGRQLARFFPPHPHLTLLDLATASVPEADADALLVSLPALKHLILDECGLLRGAGETRDREGEWAALGKRCALAGVRRAREREKEAKVWAQAQARERDEQPVPRERRPRRGRRGLATATISLRASPERGSSSQTAAVTAVPPPATARRGRRGVAPATVSHEGGSSSQVTTLVPEPAPASTRLHWHKVRIIPPAPSLKSLSTTPPTLTDVASARAQFNTGWREGITQLNNTRARLRQSLSNGYRVIMFADGEEGEDDADEEEDDEGMRGFRDVPVYDQMAFEELTEEEYPPPVLCLVGPARDAAHEEGCGHAEAWRTWADVDGLPT